MPTVTVPMLRQMLTAPGFPAVAVMGHDAPDTDTVVSALAEAYRRAAAGENARPAVRCDALPREIRWLLGDLADAVPLTGDPAVAAWADDPAVRLVLTDHHDEPPERMARVTAVIDHHLPPPGTAFPGIETEIEPVGAATTLVVLRWRRDGLTPDAAVARILLGAILMDTEDLYPSKTGPADLDAAGWLMSVCGEQAGLFDALRGELLAESDPEVLFTRDHRTFPGMGFAILKVWADALPDEDFLRRRLAEERAATGQMLTLAKVTLYTPRGLEEDRYFVCADPDTTARVTETLLSAGGAAAFLHAPDEVIFPKGANHPSRKRLTPLLLPLLR